MRLVVVGLVTFLLSLGGTTGGLVLKARKAIPAAPDSAAVLADPAKARGDSAQPHLASDTSKTHADSVMPAAGDSVAHADSTAAVRGAATSALGASPSGNAVGPAPADAAASTAATGRSAAAYKQLARIFSNMKTTDAAKVLAYMSDEEVHGVLEQLGVRPAAGLLAALPKERAAILSRRMLGAGGKKDSTP